MHSRALTSQESLRSKWLFLDGKLIHTLVPASPASLESPPVVFLPGFVVSSRYVEPAAERLTAFCRTYVPDLPGFGKSEKPRKVPDLPDIASYLEAWMQAVGLSRVALVGSSFGCQIASEFALRYPDRVSRMIMIGPTIDPEARTHLKIMARWMVNTFRESSLPRSLIADYLRVSPLWVLRLGKNALRDRIEDKLPGIYAPTLVIRGSRDPICPQKWAERVASLLPNGRLEVIPDASHSIVHFWPQEFASLAIPFLREESHVKQHTPQPQ